MIFLLVWDALSLTRLAFTKSLQFKGCFWAKHSTNFHEISHIYVESSRGGQKTHKKGGNMTERDYYSMFKGAPDVLTVVEAAKLLRLGKNKPYDLIKSGYLHSIKAGGKIIVPKVCLIEFLCNENNYQKKR